jgi:hypothetical protein
MEPYGEYDQALENYQELSGLGREGETVLELAGLIPQTTIYSTPNVMHTRSRAVSFQNAPLLWRLTLNDPERKESPVESHKMLIIYNNEDPESAIPYGEQSLAIAGSTTRARNGIWPA